MADSAVISRVNPSCRSYRGIMGVSTPEESLTLVRQESDNFRRLAVEVGWFGVAYPALGTFLSVYAINLGADALALGLLSSLPAVTMFLGTFLAGWWNDRYPDIMQGYVAPALLTRARLLFLALVPFAPPEWRVTVLIGGLAFMGVVTGLGNVVFTVLMQRAVTRRRFIDLISRRQLMINLGLAISTLALGFWLENAPFPLNYQVMQVAAFGAWMFSYTYVVGVRPLPEEALSEPDAPPLSEKGHPWHDPAFRGLALRVGLVLTCYIAVLPIIPLRLVNDLGAAEGFISLYSFLELMGAVGIALVARRLIDRFGHLNVVAGAMTITGLCMVALALTPARELVLPVALLNGAAWVATDISQFSFYAQKIRAARTTAYSSAFNQVGMVASVIGPLIGSTLASGGVALPVVLLIGAGLRIASGWTMRTYRTPQPAPARQPAA